MTRGFTLIESVLYIAIFSIVIEGAVSGVFSITETTERNEAKASAENQQLFIAEKSTYEI